MLSCSPGIKHEYCCTVVQIGECFPIEDADRIQKTLVNGMSMVISKDIKPGDIMIYAANETALNPDFLRVNNLYGISDYTMNANRSEVEKLLESDHEKAKALCGFFTPQNRVKMLKLKGTYSFGFLFGTEALANWYPKVRAYDFSSHIGEDFDTVDGVLFVKAYTPPLKRPSGSTGNSGRTFDKRERFNRMIDGNFQLHYDSQQLQRSMARISPTDIVTVSVKIHGTSAIYGRVECRIPKRLPIYSRLWNSIAKFLKLSDKHRIPDFTLGQDNVYASRTVLKNKYTDLKNPKNTTTSDIWGYYNDLLAKHLPDNTIIYGEIFGYDRGSSTCIQKNYDYGLPVGHSRFMPYRIVRITDGKFIEWEVQEVFQWTMKMIETYPDLQGVLYPIQIVYHGKLTDRYPEIAVDDYWHEKVLEAMKADKKCFGMETNEVLCKNKVPREGVCIRIDNDPRPENFKLKCAKFLSKESKDIDAGEVDIEMQEAGYGV